MHIASWSLCAQTSWRLCEGGTGEREKRHAVHLHTRAAVLSSWPSGPDELAFGGGQGGTWIEICRQQGAQWLVSSALNLFFNCVLSESARAHRTTAESFTPHSLDNPQTKHSF